MKNKICWDEYDLSQLFSKVAGAAYMYSKESGRGQETYNGNMTMLALDKLPHAMLYRARVCEQFIDEIKARSYDMLQEEYDAKDNIGKAKWHKEEADKYSRLLKDELSEDRDKEVISEYEQEQQMHDSFAFRLENFTEEALADEDNQYKFGE